MNMVFPLCTAICVMMMLGMNNVACLVFQVRLTQCHLSMWLLAIDYGFVPTDLVHNACQCVLITASCCVTCCRIVICSLGEITCAMPTVYVFSLSLPSWWKLVSLSDWIIAAWFGDRWLECVVSFKTPAEQTSWTGWWLGRWLPVCKLTWLFLMSASSKTGMVYALSWWRGDVCIVNHFSSQDTAFQGFLDIGSQCSRLC